MKRILRSKGLSATNGGVNVSRAIQATHILTWTAALKHCSCRLSLLLFATFHFRTCTNQTANILTWIAVKSSNVALRYNICYIQHPSDISLRCTVNSPLQQSHILRSTGWNEKVLQWALPQLNHCQKRIHTLSTIWYRVYVVRHPSGAHDLMAQPV